MKPEAWVSIILSFNTSSSFLFPKITSFTYCSLHFYCCTQSTLCSLSVSELCCTDQLAHFDHLDALSQNGHAHSASLREAEFLPWRAFIMVSTYALNAIYPGWIFFILLLWIFPKLVNGFHTYWAWKVQAVGRKKLRGKWQKEQTTQFDKLISSVKWAKYVSQYKIMFPFPDNDPFPRT